jgi:alanine racemase
MCMIDVTEIPEVKAQEHVVLMGTQGDKKITAHDLARWAETIPYEILCSIGARVSRTFKEQETWGEANTTTRTGWASST